MPKELSFEPVMQTRFGKDEGNCFSACIASLFAGIEVDNVPVFGGENWWVDFTGWSVKNLGYIPLLIFADADMPYGWPPDTYYLVGGKSPRGNFDHSIVYLAGEFVHDPYPNGEGKLETIVDYIIFIPAK